MANPSINVADCVATNEMPWIPTALGKSFRPLRFETDGWSELMRLEPGSVVALHRHTGPVHAFTLSGVREIIATNEVVGPGDYVYESAGHVDAWGAVGEVPCVVHIKVLGAVEYLDDEDRVIEVADSGSQCATYLAWCEQHGVTPAPHILH